MRRFRYIIPAILILTFLATAEAGTPPVPAERSKCQVCGMFVSKYKDWIASIVYKDKSVLFFDGPKDLFRFYIEPGRFGSKRKASDVASIYVKDYYSLEEIDALRAYYVMGSDVLGPMGMELVPFAAKDDAKAFLKDHGGKRLLQFQEVNQNILKGLQ